MITGGLGFIGSNLKHILEKEGHETFIFDRIRFNGDNYIRGDITEYRSIEEAFEMARPDAVFHLAGMVSRKECEETPHLAIETNANGTLNICMLCNKFSSRLIYSGSSEEYGSVDWSKPVSENTPLGEPTGIYSLTKRMADEIVQTYAHHKRLQATTMRLFMLYGPGEVPSDYRSALIRFFNWALNNKPLIVHKETERSWCHINDAAEAMKLILERKQAQPYEIFNIGKEEPTSTEELAKKIIKICDSHSDLKVIPVEKTIIPIKRASFKKAKDLLNWKAQIPLDQGLVDVKNWMESYLKDNDKEFKNY